MEQFLDLSTLKMQAHEEESYMDSLGIVLAEYLEVILTVKEEELHQEPLPSLPAKEKRRQRDYTFADKIKAVAEVLLDEKTQASVCRAMKIPGTTLRGWCKNKAVLGALPEKPASLKANKLKTAKEQKRAASTATTKAIAGNSSTGQDFCGSQDQSCRQETKRPVLAPATPARCSLRQASRKRSRTASNKHQPPALSINRRSELPTLASQETSPVCFSREDFMRQLGLQPVTAVTPSSLRHPTSK